MVSNLTKKMTLNRVECRKWTSALTPKTSNKSIVVIVVIPFRFNLEDYGTCHFLRCLLACSLPSFLAIHNIFSLFFSQKSTILVCNSTTYCSQVVLIHKFFLHYLIHTPNEILFPFLYCTSSWEWEVHWIPYVGRPMVQNSIICLVYICKELCWFFSL